MPASPSSVFESPRLYGREIALPPIERGESDYIQSQAYRVRRLTPDKPASVFECPRLYGWELGSATTTATSG